MDDKQRRIKRLHSSIESLNTSFLGWLQEQIQSKPHKLVTAGVTDYLRHSRKLELEFADVLKEKRNERERSESEEELDGRRPSPSLISLYPHRNTKIVHFIRHGEGWHNIGFGNHDAHLTALGWRQAHALGRHMRSHVVTREVQLVVVSPLMRTLETAAGVFGIHPEESSGMDTDDVLMVEQTEERNVRTNHKEILVRPGLRTLAHELCRERLGPGPCDSRRRRSESATMFPGVDFSLISDEEDRLWRPNAPEPESSVVERGKRFLQMISELPETNIAVVTHSAFLWFTLAVFGGDLMHPVREHLQRWYENCEMRTVVMMDGEGRTITRLSEDFPGGHVFAEPQKSLLDATEIEAMQKGRGAAGFEDAIEY